MASVSGAPPRRGLFESPSLTSIKKRLSLTSNSGNDAEYDSSGSGPLAGGSSKTTTVKTLKTPTTIPTKTTSSSTKTKTCKLPAKSAGRHVQQKENTLRTPAANTNTKRFSRVPTLLPGNVEKMKVMKNTSQDVSPQRSRPILKDLRNQATKFIVPKPSVTPPSPSPRRSTVFTPVRPLSVAAKCKVKPTVPLKEMHPAVPTIPSPRPNLPLPPTPTVVLPSIPSFSSLSTSDSFDDGIRNSNSIASWTASSVSASYNSLAAAGDSLGSNLNQQQLATTSRHAPFPIPPSTSSVNIACLIDRTMARKSNASLRSENDIRKATMPQSISLSTVDSFAPLDPSIPWPGKTPIPTPLPSFPTGASDMAVLSSDDSRALVSDESADDLVSESCSTKQFFLDGAGEKQETWEANGDLRSNDEDENEEEDDVDSDADPFSFDSYPNIRSPVTERVQAAAFATSLAEESVIPTAASVPVIVVSAPLDGTIYADVQPAPPEDNLHLHPNWSSEQLADLQTNEHISAIVEGDPKTGADDDIYVEQHGAYYVYSVARNVPSIVIVDPSGKAMIEDESFENDESLNVCMGTTVSAQDSSDAATDSDEGESVSTSNSLTVPSLSDVSFWSRRNSLASTSSGTSSATEDSSIAPNQPLGPKSIWDSSGDEMGMEDDLGNASIDSESSSHGSEDSMTRMLREIAEENGDGNSTTHNIGLGMLESVHGDGGIDELGRSRERLITVTRQAFHHEASDDGAVDEVVFTGENMEAAAIFSPRLGQDRAYLQSLVNVVPTVDSFEALIQHLDQGSGYSGLLSASRTFSSERGCEGARAVGACSSSTKSPARVTGDGRSPADLDELDGIGIAVCESMDGVNEIVECFGSIDFELRHKAASRLTASVSAQSAGTYASSAMFPSVSVRDIVTVIRDESGLEMDDDEVSDNTNPSKEKAPVIVLTGETGGTQELHRPSLSCAFYAEGFLQASTQDNPSQKVSSDNMVGHLPVRAITAQPSTGYGDIPHDDSSTWAALVEDCLLCILNEEPDSDNPDSDADTKSDMHAQELAPARPTTPFTVEPAILEKSIQLPPLGPSFVSPPELRQTAIAITVLRHRWRKCISPTPPPSPPLNVRRSRRGDHLRSRHHPQCKPIHKSAIPNEFERPLPRVRFADSPIIGHTASHWHPNIDEQRVGGRLKPSRSLFSYFNFKFKKSPSCNDIPVLPSILLNATTPRPRPSIPYPRPAHDRGDHASRSRLRRTWSSFKQALTPPPNEASERRRRERQHKAIEKQVEALRAVVYGEERVKSKCTKFPGVMKKMFGSGWGRRSMGALEGSPRQHD